MGQNTIHGLGLSFLIECVVSHNFFLLVIIVLFFITVIRGLIVFFCRANYSIYGFLLFLGEGFPNISDSLTFIGNRLLLIVDIAIRVLNFVTLQGHTDNEHSYLFLFLRKTINDFFNGFRRRFLRFLFRFFFGIFFLSFLILVNKLTIGDINRLIKVDNGLFISAVLMSNYRINERTRICSGINQAQFPNNAMDNIRSILLQLISIDGHRTNITMLHKLLSVNAVLCLIKDAVGINAITSIFQKCMTDDILHATMVMIPDKRHLCSILIGKCPGTNNPAICTFDIISGSIAAKIIPKCHFYYFTPFLLVSSQKIHLLRHLQTLAHSQHLCCGF